MEWKKANILWNFSTVLSSLAFINFFLIIRWKKGANFHSTVLKKITCISKILINFKNKINHSIKFKKFSYSDNTCISI